MMYDMKKSPLVSVIIPTYNRPDLLSCAIGSVLDQTYKNFEIIVINDYGEDVFDVVESFESDNIEYLCHIKNSGLSYTRNTGIKVSKGEILCYLDDDDLFLPHYLEELVQIYETHKDVNIIYTDAAYVNETIKKSQRLVVSETDTFIGNEYSYQKLLIDNYIPINSLSHRKSILKEIGLFDENMKSHEDWDFLIRLGKEYDFYYINKITVEVRNRIDLQDNMLSQGKGDLYSVYKKIYSRYPSRSFEVLEERQKKLFFLAKYEKKYTIFFLELFKTPINLILFIYLSITFLKKRYVSK